MPSAALRVGTTTRRLSSQTFAACSAARRTFGLFGRSRTSRARARRATRSSSPVLGLADWPPLRIWSTPNSSNTLARPSPATTATIAGPGLIGAVARDAPFVEWPSPRGDAGELGRLRLLDVAGLVVEVLDADPAQAAEPQPVADDLVRPLVVDVDLERPGVAGDEHALADRLEVVADRVDVERLPGWAWTRNIVS